MREIRLTVGATTAAVSTLLAVYMGGLALGAAAFGRLVDRSRAPLRLYALLELAIGLYALLLPVLASWAGPVYVALARSVPESPALLLVLRATYGAVLVLPPTILMGGTLPVLARFVGRCERTFGRELGTLYGANLVGACLGSLAAAFLLIPALGLRGATVSAVLANLGIGLAALAWNARDRGPAAVTETAGGGAPVARPPADRLRALLTATAFVSGFTSLGYEVLWTRVLLFAFTSTLQAFALILATFLAGLALGSGLFALVERRGPRLRLLSAALSFGGLLALVMVPLSLRATEIVRWFAAGASSGPGAVTAGMALAAGLVILLPATLMGFVFPMVSRLLTPDLRHAGKGIGRAYMVNTVGAVLGSLATGFVLIPLLGLKGALVTLAAVQAAMGWALLPWAEGRAAARRLALLSGLGLLAGVAGAAVLLRGPNPFDPVPGRDVVAHRDGVSASVSVVRNERGGKSLRIDGFEAASSDAVGAYMGMMTHIPMLLHPDPRAVLVICFGTGTTAGAGLRYPGARVDVVDIDANVLAMAGHFREVNGGVAESPRARLVVDDGRNYLLTTLRRYDVITSEPMPPVFAGVTNLYSREYYELARRRLKPGGLLVQWLPFHLVSASEAWSILGTVQAVFPETTLWVHGLTGIIVARADGPVEIDPGRVSARLADPGLRGELARFGVRGAAAFVDLYMLGPDGARRVAGDAALVTDDFPLLETHAPLWLGGRRVVGLLGLNEAQALEAVYRQRLAERLPLSPSPDAERCRQGWALDSYRLLGGFYLDTGLPDQAAAAFGAGLETARTPPERALLLCDLAAAAVRRGDAGEARRRVADSLALVPGYPPALRLKEALDPVVPSK
ncbi:MAG: fused MFS/spermidine synthase [Acidobacteria bacterium]|nr:fused MFS/spermidine synthase [Acidobacteriota bacterium]